MSAKKSAAVKQPEAAKKPAAVPHNRGILEAIRTGFKAGHHTNADITKYLQQQKVTASPATIKTQINKLRNAAGLTDRKHSNGPVAKIRQLFAEGKGIVTYPAMIEAMDQDKKIVCSAATVKTQVIRLRKAHGLSKPQALTPKELAAKRTAAHEKAKERKASQPVAS